MRKVLTGLGLSWYHSGLTPTGVLLYLHGMGLSIVVLSYATELLTHLVVIRCVGWGLFLLFPTVMLFTVSTINRKCPKNHLESQE